MSSTRRRSYGPAEGNQGGTQTSSSWGNRRTSTLHRGAKAVSVMLLLSCAWTAQALFRDVEIVCPCEAKTDDGSETITLTFGVRNFRPTDSGQLRLRLVPGWARHSILPESSRRRIAEIGLDSVEDNTAVASASHVAEDLRQYPEDMTRLALSLDEKHGNYWEKQDWVELTSQDMDTSQATDASFYASDVDTLKDSDGDGVSDFNEALQGTDPEDDASTPGTTTIDVLALYDPHFGTLFQGDPYTRIHHLVEYTNSRFVDSRTNIRLRIVGIREIEVPNPLHNFSTPPRDATGEAAELHGADLMLLFRGRQPTHSIQGFAGLGGSRDRGLMHTEYGAAVLAVVLSHRRSTTAAHEIGHLLGLAHSFLQGESNGSFRWSRGHYYTRNFGTIMAYSRHRYGVFANPAADCGGVPCGVTVDRLDGANAVRSLDTVRFQAAGYRESKSDSDDDGFVDPADAFPQDPAEWRDTDSDGVGNYADSDDDGDGVSDNEDEFPLDPDEWLDRDRDGVGDNADKDLAETPIIPDEHLRPIVERALGEPPGSEITADDLATLTELEARSGYVSGGYVRDLTGLEFATNLETLSLSNNRVADISQVASMSQLSTLELTSNLITDISPISNLYKLEFLRFVDNRVSDISPLKDLTALTGLDFLGNDEISDISALSRLTGLNLLGFSLHGVSDLAPLSKLTNLRSLTLESANGTTLEDVLSLPIVPDLFSFWFNDSRLSDLPSLSPLAHLTSLGMDDNEISDIAPVAELTDLAFLYMSRNAISDVMPLSKLTQLSALYLHENRISDISPLSALNGLRWVGLSSNRISDLSPLSSLQSLENLQLRDNRISDLSPLRELKNLTTLWLTGNEISDLSPLSALTGLTDLEARSNEISDLTPLSELTELASLDLLFNQIEDVSPISGLSALTSLDLSYNKISDISPLVDHPGLANGGRLNLVGNPLTYVALETHIVALQRNGVNVSYTRPDLDIPDPGLRLAIAKALGVSEDTVITRAMVAQLQEFDAANSGITDLTGLEAATNLKALHLNSNAISDLSPLEFLYQIQYLDLRDNSIFDISVVRGLPRLHRVYLNGNPLNRESEEILVAELRSIINVSVVWTDVVERRSAWLVPPASDETREGFVRIVNHSGQSGVVYVEAIDDEGRFHDPISLSVDAGETVHFNSSDLERGNASKGLSGGVGPGIGNNWRLELWSGLDIEALGYIRTEDGFLTAMHDVAPMIGRTHQVVTFNPGSNVNQVSKLRIVNLGLDNANVWINGVDDAGVESTEQVRASVPAGSSVMLRATDLESGTGLDGALGTGSGKWRLAVTSDWPVVVQSLLESPSGHLTNLSTVPPEPEDGVHVVPLFPSASDPSAREGFVRVANHSAQAGELLIEAYDTSDTAYDTLRLSIEANSTVHFNSHDLEMGNTRKGLSGRTGAGRGDWMLALSSQLELDVLSYIRTPDGFLTSMHDVVPAADGEHRVATFNPGSNTNQVSQLRLVNSGDEEATVRVTGVDDRAASPGSPLRLGVPAGSSRTFTAAELEAGGDDMEGALGDGAGKWRLIVNSDRPILVMSLLASPTGHLSNLSTIPVRGTEDGSESTRHR